MGSEWIAVPVCCEQEIDAGLDGGLELSTGWSSGVGSAELGSTVACREQEARGQRARAELGAAWVLGGGVGTGHGGAVRCLLAWEAAVIEIRADCRI